jgi:uncharacterized protein
MNALIPHVRYLVLLLTNRCNLSCRYCYCPDSDLELHMNQDIMRWAVEIAASHGKQFHVQLSGGEPCLNSELIYETVAEVRKSAPKATIAIQTNGTLLNSSLARFFKEKEVQVGVSIDGPPSVHEKSRGMFGEMFAGIECLESNGVPWRATAVVTADSVEHLWRLVLLISRFKTARGIALDFLTHKRGAVENNVLPATSEAVERGIYRMLETLETINRSSRPMIRFREAEAVARYMHSGKPDNFCHACNGESMAVCPDGSVYPCSQLSGEQRYCAGNIRSAIDWTKLRLTGPSLQSSNCFLCTLKGRCPGDCPGRLAYNDGNEQRAVCTLYRTIYAFQKKEQVV